MNRFLVVKVIPYFVWLNERTKKYEIVNNWRENVCEVIAEDVEAVKKTLSITGIIEGKHYHDILKFIGTI